MSISKLFLPKSFSVASHTDNITSGSIFVAIDGYKQNGFDFIDLAIKRGAVRVVLHKDANISALIPKYPNIKFTLVENTRKSLAILAAKKLNLPVSKLKIIGVTGTKGKTSTTFLIEYLLQKAGHKTALLGTIKNTILDQEIESSQTTMGSDWLHVFFNECVKAGVEYVVMEVSSHALSLERVYGFEFDIACFTNLAAEHMDFYEDLESYFEAKSILFSQIKQCGMAIINVDDEWGKKLKASLKRKNLKLISFGKNRNVFIKKNDLSGLNIEILSDGKTFKLGSSLFGEFNAHNLSMAFFVCKSLGIDNNLMLKNVSKFPGIPGRIQKHKLKNGAYAFVDYAHNPSSFEAVLRPLSVFSNNLIVVFGCGGDRDKTKRPFMGKIASLYGDKIIISNDNPRNEDPKLIISDILCGILPSKKEFTYVEMNRKDAISMAVELSKKGSIIALLGKGHENYYLVGDKKFYFDDYEEISKF